MPARFLRIAPYGVLLLVAAFLYWAAGRIDAPTGGRIGPDVWPRAVIVFMALLCVYEIVKRLVVRSDFEAKGLLGSTAAKAEPDEGEAQGAQSAAPPPDYPMLAGGIGLILAYVLAVPWLGFFVTTALFLAAFQWVGGLRRPVLVAAIGLAGSLALVFVFMRVAYISLPLGDGPFRALSLALMRAIGVT